MLPLAIPYQANAVTNYHRTGGNLDALDEDERLVWDRKDTFETIDDATITDDIYELLAAMEVGHEKRLDAFYSLTHLHPAPTLFTAHTVKTAS